VARLRGSVLLSAAVGLLVALWAAAGHGRPAGGALLAGLAFCALGVGTVALLRARPGPLPSFLALGGLYFAALAALRWITGGSPGLPDALGGACYGALLTWLMRAPRSRAGGSRRPNGDG
jgi:hypothetical protein